MAETRDGLTETAAVTEARGSARSSGDSRLGAIATGFALGLLVGGLAVFAVTRPDSSATDAAESAPPTTVAEESVTIEFVNPPDESELSFGDVVSVEITESRCQLDERSGRPEVVGRVRNTLEQPARFTISTRFTYDDGELIDAVDFVQDVLLPGQVTEFQLDAVGIAPDKFEQNRDRGFNCTEPVVTYSGPD